MAPESGGLAVHELELLGGGVPNSSSELLGVCSWYVDLGGPDETVARKEDISYGAPNRGVSSGPSQHRACSLERTLCIKTEKVDLRAPTLYR